MKQVILIVVVWLVVVNGFGLIALNRLALQPDQAYQWIDPATYRQPRSWNPLSLHSRWDSYWILSVADRGYQYQADQLSNIVFFPLYPALIRLIGPMTNHNLALAGWLISSAMLGAACLLLFRLVREFHHQADPIRTILLLLVFPTAVFFNAVYTEATFLALSVGAFYAMRRQRFWIAGLLGLFAALTRANGFLLAVPLVWEYGQRAWRDRRIRWDALSPLLPPLGTALFFLFHRLWLGNGLLFFEVERSWGRSFALNADHLSLFSRAATSNLMIDLGLLVSAIVAAGFVMYRIRVSYGLYMLASLAVPVATGTLLSIGRFALVLFPIAILGATIRHRGAAWAWTLTSTLFFALGVILYVNWYWAG